MHINELFNEIKNLLDKENVDIPKLKKYSDEYINLLSIKLINKEPFYGYFTALMIKSTDLLMPFAAGVYIKKGKVFLETNPLLLYHNTQDEITAILKHEIFHVIHKHLENNDGKANNDYDHRVINIAMDAAINQYIKGLPEGTVTLQYISDYFKIDIKNIEKNETWLYYYNIMKQSDVYNKEKENHFNFKNELEKLLKELKEKDNITKNDLEELLSKLNDKMMDAHSYWKKGDSNDLEKAVSAELINKIIKSAIESCRGNVPYEIEDTLKMLKNSKPIITWQQELKKFIGNARSGHRKSIFRRNRKQSGRFDLRGNLPDKVVKIVVAIDTSGSMSEEVLSYVFNEIFAILKYNKFKLTVIECDCEITKIYTARNKKEVNLKVTGRGGTSFEPVFKYLKEEGKRINPDLLIYFSDGYGDSEINPLYKPSGYNLMWVITSENGNHLNPKDILSLNDPMTRYIKKLKI